jgi:hypothetical protein
MALLFLLAAFALWWVWPRKSTDLAKARRRLAVSRNADAQTIEAAFRAALFKAHPDHGGTAQDTASLTAARDLLLASVTNTRHNPRL